MIRYRMRTAGALIAGASLLATAACGGSSSKSNSSSESVTKGGTFQIVSAGDVGNLDTSQAYEVIAWTLFRAVTRQLVSYEGGKDLVSGTEVKPDLATFKKSDDGLTYTFSLKDGITYAGSTDRAIVAKDFVYAIKRLCDPNGPSGAIGYYTGTIKGMSAYCDGFKKVKTGDPKLVKAYIDGNDVAGMKASDDKTVTFTLTQPAGDFLNILALPFATPLPEEIYSAYLTDSPEMRQHFASSGPYFIKSYDPGKKFVFARNPKWVAATDDLRKAYVDGIEVTITEGVADQSQFDQITAGTADMSLDLTQPPSTEVQKLKGSNAKRLRIVPEGRVDYMVFNLKPNADTACAKALAKRDVRLAFQSAVNKNNLIQTRGGLYVGKPHAQILTSTISGYQKNDEFSVNNGDGDAAKAKEMLAKAGYPDGLTCKYLYREKNHGADVAATLKEDMAKAGIKLDLVLVPSADYYAKNLQQPSVKTWDIATPGWSPDWQGNAARTFFVPLLSKNCDKGTTNYGCYSNPKVEEGIVKALASNDPAKDWAVVDKTATEDLPWVPLDELNAISITSERTKNFKWFNFSNNADLANVAVM